jgi:hypothetical protein
MARRSDGATLAKDMRTEPEFLLSMRKHTKSTDFACFIRNVTPQAIALTVPFGQMEGRPRISEQQRQEIIRQNRSRVAGVTTTPSATAAAPPPQLIPSVQIETPELL